MPKAGLFDAQLQYLKNKLPQLGFFSTLDELIRAAPQEKMPAQQWQSYLQPGRTLTREGVNFPLKQEELDVTGLPQTLQAFQTPGENRSNLHSMFGAMSKGMQFEDDPIPKSVLLEALHRNRPEFNLTKGVQDTGTRQGVLPEVAAGRGIRPYPVVQDAQYPEHAHEAGVPGSYEENVTTSPDFGTFPSHFSPQDISWSRTTRHPIGDDATARLIEEIQSDRHEAAAEKFYQDPRTGGLSSQIGSADPADFNQIRRGYRTLEDESTLSSLSGSLTPDEQAIRSKPPDTPWKDPADYALLELRKQLLNSVNQGDSYLALTRGADQVQRYEQGMGGGKGEGMSYIYDQVYPSALKKLARQYGANVSDLPINVGRGKLDTRPQTLVDHGVETPNDLLNTAPNEQEKWTRAASLVDDFNRFGGDDTHFDSLLDNAKHYVDQHFNGVDFPSGAFGWEEENFRGYLNALHSIWDSYAQEEPAAMAAKTKPEPKTFPAMHITPEVADKIKKAGVPLFTAAGATALGLGNSDNANANVVEDAALQRDNSAMAEGGQVTFALRRLLAQLGENPEVVGKSATQRLGELGQKVLPNPPVVDPLATRTTAQQIADQATHNAAAAKARTMQTPDVLAQRLKAGFVDPAELNHLLYTNPETTSLINHYQGGVDKNLLSGDTKDALISHLGTLGSTNPPQVVQPIDHVKSALQRLGITPPDSAVAEPPAMASGGQVQSHLGSVTENTPYPFSGGKGIENLVRASLMRLGLPAPDSLEDASPTLQLPNSFYTWGDEIPTRGFAEGGSTDDSSLTAISDFLKRYGGPHVQRVGTGIAKQLYGLDKNGHLVFGGRAWTKDQGGTPAGILDQVASIPANTIPIANLLGGTSPADVRAQSGHSDEIPTPQWSSDAAARLAALDSKVSSATGVGPAQTLPEHVEDAAAMLATPFPASKVAKEAPTLQRMLEFLTPVRPPSLGRYASDSAMLGGTSSGLDALAARLAAQKATPPDNAQADPQFEQTALDYTNSAGHAGGGKILGDIDKLVTSRRDVLKGLAAAVGAAAIPAGMKAMKELPQAADQAAARGVTSMTEPLGKRYVYVEPTHEPINNLEDAQFALSHNNFDDLDYSGGKALGFRKLSENDSEHGAYQVLIEAPHTVLDQASNDAVEFGLSEHPHPQWAIHPDEVPNAHPVHQALQAVKDNVFGASDEPNWMAAERQLSQIPGHERVIPQYNAMKGAFTGDLEGEEDNFEMNDRVNRFHQALDDLSAEHGVPIARDPNVE